MKTMHLLFFSIAFILASLLQNSVRADGLPLYYYQEPKLANFGDVLAYKIVEKIVGRPVEVAKHYYKGKKLLGLGSIFYFAREGDIIWASGINGKTLDKKYYTFENLDIRAVRGPLSRNFLMAYFNIYVPEVYGDPALLMPYLFPEFKRAKEPKYEYIVIPHYSEEHLFPRTEKDEHIVYPNDPWDVVVRKILNSKLVISSSLHGIVVAEAYGIPARMLHFGETRHKFFFKYQDYYSGTGRYTFQYAISVEEAISMGGESPAICDVEKLYEAFPFEQWPETKFKKINWKR
jgi:pyruvyltransferase